VLSWQTLVRRVIPQIFWIVTGRALRWVKEWPRFTWFARVMKLRFRLLYICRRQMPWNACWIKCLLRLNTFRQTRHQKWFSTNWEPLICVNHNYMGNTSRYSEKCTQLGCCQLKYESYSVLSHFASTSELPPYHWWWEIQTVMRDAYFALDPSTRQTQ